MDLLTKQLLAQHEMRITESLRKAGLGESYYWLRLGDKAEMFSSVEEMINRLNETVPAPWKVHRKGDKYTILVADKFKNGTPIHAFKTEDKDQEVPRALDDDELRFLVAYRGESNDKAEMGCAAVGGGAAGGFAVGTAHLPKRKKADDEEGIDAYDDMDAAFPKVKSQMRLLTKALEAAGVKVVATTPPDYDADGEIELENDVSIQVCMDGMMSIATWLPDEEAILHGIDSRSIPEIVKAVGGKAESDAVQPVPPAEPVYGNKPMLPKYLKKGKKEPKGDFRTQLMKGLKQQCESTHHEAPEVEDTIKYGHGGYATLVKEVEGYHVEKDAWMVIAQDGKRHYIQPWGMEDGHMTWETISSERIGGPSKFPSDRQHLDKDVAEGEDSDYYHPDDDTEPEEPTEPNEDDITTTDDNKWYQYGKLYHTGDRKSLAAKMDHDQFWPDVWSISDHGNTVLISADIADARKDSEEVVQSFNYEKKDKKKEAFGVTGTSNQGGMVQPLPKVGKGDSCWVCGTPIISTTSCHACAADLG